MTAGGEAVITGSTDSADFPTSGSGDSSHNGFSDVFVLKLSADGQTLAYSTFIGGSEGETGNSLALTAAGEALVTGRTGSADFPTSVNAYDSSFNGSSDVFVLKLSADGGTLAYSTFIGGSSWDYGQSLGLTATDEVVLTGFTYSADFPISGNAYDSEYNGGLYDLFVLKLSADGGTLAYSTFIGGSDREEGQSLALTAAGEAFITGETWSANFPTSANAYDSSYNGDRDVFVLKLSADGGTLAYSTFIGGSDNDRGYSLALTAAGEAVVTGKTYSADFPTSANTYDSSHNGGLSDVFVLKLSADGGTLAYSTFIGGSGNDYGYSLALTAVGEAVVTGYTSSANFPTSEGAYDSSHNGENDVFVLKLSADHGTLAYSTFIGGSGNDYGSMRVTAEGQTFLGGLTYSADFPTSANAYDTSHNGDQDAFLLRLDGLAQVFDAYESDDSCEEASSISTDGRVQDHSFHAAGDVDWVSFEAISDTEYLIEVRTPDESVADVVLEVHDGCGGVPSESQGPAFSPDIRLRFRAPQSGPLYVRLNNDDGSVGGGQFSYQLSVRALGDSASPGVLVLVAGRIRPNDSLQDEIHEVTNQVYRLFKANGYDDERIYYLATDLSLDADGDGASDVDAQASRDNVQAAITSWAVDKVGPDRAFTLYLMDHGGINELYLNGYNQFITPNDVDGWLDTLEAEAPGVRVNVVVEACHAGSFIGAPQSLSQPGRVVMASTGIYNLAYPSDTGAFFSDALVAALGRGASLYGAFSEAQSAAKQAHPDQTPWLDDDGDGVPNESQDGQEAQLRGFAYAGTLSAEQLWPPYIASAEIGPIKEGTGVISADIRDDRSILSVTAIIYPPSYTPPDQNAQEMPQEKLPALALRDSDGDGIYRATYQNFDEAGTYRIVLYALDGDEQQARPKELTLEVSGGNQLYLPLIIGK